MSGPCTIMFIRHGEKPGDDGPPRGINHEGEHDPHSLSVRGWTRAGALAALFAHAPLASHPQVVVPARIIATKSTDDYKSKREADTARPLAERLVLSVDQEFEHSQADQLATSVLTDARPALIVWHHGSMADLVRHFPLSDPDSVPHHWPEDRFDLVWVLSKVAEAGAYDFTVVPQRVLAGDAGTS